MPEIGHLLGKIRITQVPEGEAPEHIRSCWVGVEIPCPFFSEEDQFSCGILSGDAREPKSVYVVLQEMAIASLEKDNPVAAAWWMEHGFPREDVALFSFRQEEVEETEEVLTREQFELLVEALEEEEYPPQN